jgi:4-hydroxy-tetrahydrodipicolinate synthase
MPFKDNLEIDFDGLKNIIEFIKISGSRGIVMPVNASEFSLLTEHERKLCVESAARAVGNSMPFVEGVSGIHSKTAVMLAKHAESAGADAVMAMPPYLLKANEGEIFDYYQEISDAVNLPIFIQNYIQPVGTPLSAEFMMHLAKNIEHVKFIKEETQFSGHVISRIVEMEKTLPAGAFFGVMGGKAGRYIIDEFRRGASGNMPACEICDIQSKIWELLENGAEREAAEIYNQILPLLNMEAVYGSAMYKRVLLFRGVIKNAHVRTFGNRDFDSFDEIEFSRIMNDIKPLMSI